MNKIAFQVCQFNTLVILAADIGSLGDHAGQYPKTTGIGVSMRAKLSPSRVIVVLLLIHPLELGLL